MGQRVHHYHEGVVPVAEDLFRAAPGAQAAVVDVGIYRQVGFEGLGRGQGFEVAGDGGEAPGLRRGARFHVRTHQDPLQAGIVVIDEAVAGAAVGLEHVLEVSSHVFPPWFYLSTNGTNDLSTNYTNLHKLKGLTWWGVDGVAWIIMIFADRFSVPLF